MGTEVVRVPVEAKERLEARKRADERFTDVIMRLTDRTVDVERFIGKYASVDLEAGVEIAKEELDKELRRSDERMEN